MKCPKCGSETHRFDNVMYACDKGDWIRHADEVINTLSERAEKAEGELKAIKEIIVRYENGSCLQKCEINCMECLTKNIIKQIGGEK